MARVDAALEAVASRQGPDYRRQPYGRHIPIAEESRFRRTQRGRMKKPRSDKPAPGLEARSELPRVPGLVRDRNQQLTLSEAQVRRAFGRALDQAARGEDILITRRKTPHAVLISVDRYRVLTGRALARDDWAVTGFDAVYLSMQTPEVKAATARGVSATPQAMGEAARAAAKPRRGV